MNNQTFVKLLNYQNWAFEQVVFAVIEQQVNQPQVVALINHILGAENIWLSRINQQPLPDPIFPNITQAEAWLALSKENHAQFLKLLQTIDDETAITYADLNANTHQSKVLDIIVHLVNHSTYHRGQIAAKMREAGHKPASTDFIIFSRMSE